MTAETPKLNLTIEQLSLIEKKIEGNKAIASDYELLDKFLTSFGIENFVIKLLTLNSIDSYDDYVSERNQKESSPRNRLLEGEILGSILGAISVLKKVITNQIP